MARSVGLIAVLPRLPLLGSLLAALAIGIAGCGSSSGNEKTPSACRAGAGAYEAALKSAPGEVRLADETPISSCLVKGQSGGELSTVGQSMVGAASELNAQAHRDPSGPAGIQLGYLVGAAAAGAETTGGIHADLIRRLIVAERYSKQQPLPPALERSLRRGYAAGHKTG